MSNPLNALKAKFSEDNRFANFGPVITQVIIRGFRCHTNTVIDIRSPITAFCGLNGTGKSTILQILSAARRALDNSERTYYLRDFFLSGRLDPSPVSEDASILIRFWQEDRNTRQLTISKSTRGRGWEGYKRRPQGKVVFFSVGSYIPKIEQRDIISLYYPKLSITDSRAVADRVHSCSCRILSQNYEDIIVKTVRHAHRSAEVLTVARDGIAYSEINMGFGESRSQYLVSVLEHLPDKSLVLIEEPETSLHPAAQSEFGRYLIDVAIEKGHQIFLTTHSEGLLRTLPDESRLYLHRDANDVKVIPGITARQAHSLMTNGYDKALSILVEDEVARAVLSEIIRSVDRYFLSTIHIGIGGGKDEIARTVRGLQDTDLKIAAVRDGDKAGSPSENIFSLPGSSSPEIEMFQNKDVAQHICTQYEIDLPNFMATVQDVECHEWFPRLAKRCMIAEDALISECARAYARSLGENERRALVDPLKEAAR